MNKRLFAQRCAAVAVALVLLAPAAGLLAGGGEEAAVDVTLKGEVLDMACYLGHESKGPEHEKCALKCAKMGQPIGLLTEDGKVYLLVADHADQTAFEQAKTFAGKQVTITGSVAGRAGMEALTVHKVSKS